MKPKKNIPLKDEIALVKQQKRNTKLVIRLSILTVAVLIVGCIVYFFGGPAIDDLFHIAKQSKINPEAKLSTNQSIVVDANSKTIQHILFDIKNWNSWYSDISRTEIENTPEEKTKFTWQKDGMIHYNSQIAIIDENGKLAFVTSGRVLGLNVSKLIYIWTIQELENNKTEVKVRVSMDGIITLWYKQEQLETSLANWLHALKIHAEKYRIIP